MKHTLILLSYACCLTPLATLAAVPLRWTVETSRATPAQFEAYQGETLYFEADLQSAGKPLEMSGLAEFFWQTNGMGSAYWETTAAVNSNRLSAVFAPEMDVGARVYNCFIGVPGTIYHAAFQLRLRPSPGAEPNTLPLPTPVIDFAKVRVLNPPWESGGGGGVNTNAVRDIAREEIAPATNRLYTTLIDSTNRLYKTLIDAKDGSAKMLPKYLHERSFDDSYPAEAEMYYKWRSGIPSASCSAVRSGNFLYRNFDYPLDDRAEFVVRMSAGPSRFASVGVAQVGTNLTEAIVTSGKPSRWYKALPGATVDGINERGVVAEINVVGGDPQTSGWHTTGDIHPLAAVRWALDNGTSAGMVASNLASRIRFPAGWSQNFHYMIADATSTYIVENGSVHAVTNGVNVMTNFRLYGDPKDTTGAGQERYDLLLGGANITNAWYTRAYLRTTNPPWVSDLAEVIAYTNEIFDAWANNPREHFRNQRINGQPWWQSVHTSVYDITNRTLRIAVQETDDWYTFAVPSAGGTDEAKVREIAEAVVAPVASSVSDLQSSKLGKADVIDPADADDTGKAADAKATKDALDSKANVPMAWYPNYIVIFDCDGNFVNGAASVEELMQSIDAKISGSNPYGSGGVGWNDEAGFVFDGCRAMIGYGSVLNAVSGDRIVFENDGNEETIDERIVRLAPAPGDYAAVSNAAMNAKIEIPQLWNAVTNASELLERALGGD